MGVQHPCLFVSFRSSQFPAGVSLTSRVGRSSEAARISRVQEPRAKTEVRQRDLGDAARAADIREIASVVPVERVGFICEGCDHNADSAAVVIVARRYPHIGLSYSR